jgi:hypothetical protein
MVVSETAAAIFDMGKPRHTFLVEVKIFSGFPNVNKKWATSFSRNGNGLLFLAKASSRKKKMGPFHPIGSPRYTLPLF